MPIHLIIVRPGAGYSPHNNQGAFDECARTYGYSLETVGDTGTDYDRYPCVDINGGRWGSTNCAKKPPHHESFAEDTVAPLLRRRIAQGLKIVLIFGSRGGQVILPKLWQLGFDLPAIIINAGCARREVHPPISGGNLALISCTEDYFETKNPVVVDEWIKMNNRQNTAKVYVLPGQAHMPRLRPVDINEWIKYCSNSSTSKLAQLEAQRAKDIDGVNEDYKSMLIFASRRGKQQEQIVRTSLTGQLQQVHKKHDKKLADFLSTL